MSRISSRWLEVTDALREMGIDTNVTRKVVIEIDASADNAINVYIEQFADSHVLQVLRSLGSNVEVIREVKTDD